MSWLDKLKQRWGVESPRQVFVILLVFALTGTSVLYVKKPFYALFGIATDSPWWAKTLGVLFIVLPIYQVLLLMFGFLLGQFKFFWAFEKRTFQRIQALFVSKNT